MNATDKLSKDALVEGYFSYGKPRNTWRVGAEFERIGVHVSGRQLDYSEPGGISDILKELGSRFHWEPIFEGSNPIAMKRGKSFLTLEPGGQLELSSSPHTALSDLFKEVSENVHELQAVTQDTETHWIATGVSPFSSPEDVEWVPKGRYRIMRDYLPQRGALAPVMMKSTSSFQAAFDYKDESDCAAKTNALLRLSPLTTALFANSPIRLGEDTGLASSRAAAWEQTDVDRTGFPESLNAGYNHEKWVDYLLDVPMMFVQEQDGWEPANGMTFREFMTRGRGGRYPTWQDWELHQTSVFPEVRVKHFIELRGADACPIPLALGGVAMWTGVLYDPTALDEATELAMSFTAVQPLHESFKSAYRFGLKGEFGHQRLSRWAEVLFGIGKRGLERYQPESLHLLAPLERLIETGESPATSQRKAFHDATSRADYLKTIAY